MASAKIRKDELEAHLREAASRRAQQYANVIGFAIRFENDDSKAEQATKNFQTILKTLSFPTAKLFSKTQTLPRVGQCPLTFDKS